ncbi:MAG: response regulator [Myxococcota bacterium]
MKHILIMEDDVSLGMGWQELLEDAGHDVTLTFSAPEAIAILDSQTVDLIITDMIIRDENNYAQPGGHPASGKTSVEP